MLPVVTMTKHMFFSHTEVGLLYEGKIAMAKDIRNKGFMYKYIVKWHGGDIEWELVQKQHKHQKQTLVNRRFSVPDNEKLSTGLFSSGKWWIL